MSMHFAISGVTLTGNMGGVAMLLSTIARLSDKYENAEFSLLSIKPRQDKAVLNEENSSIKNLQVIFSYYVFLMFLYLPLSILFWPFAKKKIVRNLFKKIPYFKAIIQADALLDLSGIAFVDHRGLPLLIYNVAVCLPAIIFGTPVYKLSQSLGPFETRLNRYLAKFVLKRCQVVIARGEKSYQHLKMLGLDNIKMLPDVTFTLDIDKNSALESSQLFSSQKFTSKVIVISPSQVVNRLCTGRGINFSKEIVTAIRELIQKGYEILLLPHSLSNDNSKNDDVKICRDIYNQFNDQKSVKMIDSVCNPTILRALIGKAYIFVGCRFHAIVSAIATGTPCLIVGWSHKYAEMAEPFQIDDCILDWSEFTAQTCLRKLEMINQNLSSIKNSMTIRLDSVKEDALKNYSL